MVPLRLLPSFSIQSIKKMSIESTKMIGVKDEKNKNSMKVAMFDNSDRLRDSIGEASVVKFLP